MKRKSILLVLCIGMILTSCESKISLNSTDVKNEKNQKNTTMENPDKGYNLPIDEDKKKEAVNDCEEIMGIIRDIYSEYNGIQEADQNTAEQDESDERNYQTKWESGHWFRSLFCYG